MAVTWNSADKSSQFMLADSDLRAFTVTGGNFGVRSTGFASSGKFYAEWTANTVYHTFYDGFGIEKTSAAFGDFYAGTSGAIIGMGAGILINGGVALGSYVTGVVGANYDFAVDLDAQLVWGRYNNGDWNDDPTANPATGTGGFSITSTVGTGVEVRPAVASATGTIDGDARFAAADWINTAPAGFGEWTGSATVEDISATPALGVALAVSLGASVPSSGQPVVIICT